MNKPSPKAYFAATVAAAAAMLGLDLVWLGVVAAPVYAEMLGPLRRDPVHWPAALVFYAMYVAVIVVYCVRRTDSPKMAARHGAELGFVAYATYELTNWAVIAGWPAKLVPIDVIWGVVLTSLVGLASKAVASRVDH